MDMGRRASGSLLQWANGCFAVILLIHAHRASAAAANCKHTHLATAANVTIFPTDALICHEARGSLRTFVVWTLKDESSGVVSIVMAAPLAATEWVGLGFSGAGEMIRSSAILATLSNRGTPHIETYYLKDKMEIVRDSTRINFTAGPEHSYDAARGTVFMAFQIDFAKSLAKPNFLLYAYGPASGANNAVRSQHIEQWMGESSFPVGVVGESAASKLAKQVKTHGALQVFGWGILLPIGAMVARYAKSFDPAWFYIHATFQVIGFIFIIAGLATGVNLAKSINVSGLTAHKGLGFFLFTLAILQVMAVVLRPGKDAKVRKYWNWYHWWVGRLALFLACINIFVGLNLGKGKQSLRTSYIVLLALELLTFAILETLYWIRWNRAPSTGTAFRWNRTSTDRGFQMSS